MKSPEPKRRFFEQLRLCLRGWRIMEDLVPGTLILQFVKAFCKASIPFVAIYMSARILTELVTGRNKQLLLFYVAVTIGATLLAVILDSLFGYILSIRRKKLSAGHEILLSRTTYAMDYAQAERKETNELRSRIETGISAFGGGLTGLSWYGDQAYEAAFSVIIALVLSAGMLRTAELSSASVLLRAVNSVWFSAILVVVAAACVYSLLHTQNKAQQNAIVFNREMSEINLRSDFYDDHYFTENKAAKDIRIFQQMPLLLREYHDNAFVPFWLCMKRWLGAIGRVQVKGAAVAAGLGGLVYLFVACKAYAGAMQIGEVVRYYGAVTQLIASVTALSSALLRLWNNTEYLELLFQYLDLPAADTKTHNLPLRNGAMTITFEHVSFRYAPDAPLVLDDVSLTLEPGRHLAIVGKNGSGKTTLIKLLCRFYEPESGRILLNGTDIRAFDREAVQALFSVVFQDFRLFAFPVGQVVAGQTSYEEERVWQALELAGIAERVRDFPGQLAQPLYKDFEEDGVELSGGEEQKIAIARAIYRDAPLVILDEPTAALDPFSEAEIYEKFDQIIGGKSAVYISHRLSSCKFCDHIVVFEQGRVVQHGTHEALLQDSGGAYAALWNAQAQYYNTNSR